MKSFQLILFQGLARRVRRGSGPGLQGVPQRTEVGRRGGPGAWGIQARPVTLICKQIHNFRETDWL